MILDGAKGIGALDVFLLMMCVVGAYALVEAPEVVRVGCVPGLFVGRVFLEQCSSIVPVAVSRTGSASGVMGVRIVLSAVAMVSARSAKRLLFVCEHVRVAMGGLCGGAMTCVDRCNGTVVQGVVSTPGELARGTPRGLTGGTPGSGAAWTRGSVTAGGCGGKGAGDMARVL